MSRPFLYPTAIRVAFAISATLAISAVLSSCCRQDSTVDDHDVDRVLTLAASAVNKKLRADSCVNPKLESSRMVLSGQSGKDGWIVAPSDRNVRYRPILSPEIGKLPNNAAQAITKAKSGLSCRHIIFFERPQFFEVKEPKRGYFQAYVGFRDGCPACGYGAIVNLQKEHGVWKMAGQGITIIWYS